MVRKTAACWVTSPMRSEAPLSPPIHCSFFHCPSVCPSSIHLHLLYSKYYEDWQVVSTTVAFCRLGLCLSSSILECGRQPWVYSPALRSPAEETSISCLWENEENILLWVANEIIYLQYFALVWAVLNLHRSDTMGDYSRCSLNRIQLHTCREDKAPLKCLNII